MSKKVVPSSPIAYINTPCDRCGSPRVVGRVWKETIDTYNGKSTIENSQIICTDPKCQKDFEKLLVEEAKKREEQRKAREVDAIALKVNSVIQNVKLRASKAKA